MNRKEIRLSVTLAGKNEVFTDAGQNKMSATGLRVECNVMYGFGTVMPTAQIRVYGVSMDKMMKLLRVRWNTMGAMMNIVKIEAGEQGKDLHTEFQGNITFAYPDFASAPDVCLVIESQMAMLESLKPQTKYTRKGKFDVADVVADIVQGMGWQLENNGFSKMDKDITLNGSDIEKLQALSNHYQFDLYIENGLIAIAPRGGARNIKVPVITPTTGLLGYPVPDMRGVTFKCLYDPLLRFGGICKIKDSIIDVCNGEWRIYGLQKSLESNSPGGNWQCDVAATWKDSKDAAISV